MLRTLFGAVLALLTLSGFAQTSISSTAPAPWQPSASYRFSDRIELFRPLPNGTEAMVFLDGDAFPHLLQKGTFQLYNLTDNSFRGSRRFSYHTGGINYLDGVVIEVKGNKVRAFDILTDKKLWKEGNSSFFGIDRAAKLVFTFTTGYAQDDHAYLRALDWRSGALRWQITLPKATPSASHLHDDGKLYLISNGLHVVDRASGHYWRLSAPTETRSYNVEWDRILGAVAVGALTGAFTGFAIKEIISG